MQAIERQRDVEAVVLAALIDAHPDRLTESAVRRELTAVENTPERLASIDEAIEGLVEVGLVAREADLLRLTPPALRAGELELGL
ncbi:MAG TPA: hypothetical protein VN671_06365 [Solirubrobacterales bacterium]|nr:hypothetical protein [Solirubrobacterales bacterium]